MRNLFKCATLVCIGFLCVGGALAQRRMIPHLTRPDGGFTTRVILTNPTETDQAYAVIAFDETGTQIDTFTGTVAAGAVTESSPPASLTCRSTTLPRST